MATAERGTIPMAKNVIVVDELGNEYAPTYAKRARGLVKQGRARWLDENTICLACPPDIIDSEDNEMENKEKIGVVEDMEIVTATEVKPDKTTADVTIADVLARMDKIIAQGEELANAIQMIHDMPVNDGFYGSEGDKLRIEAIRDICSSREITNQKMLDMLDEMLHPNNGKSSIVDKVLKYDFTGVYGDTADRILSFIERNS